MKHDNARRRWVRAATAVGLSTLLLGAECVATTQAGAVVAEAACTPAALPTFGGSNGAVSWMTSGGLDVGGADTTDHWDDGSSVAAAAYWTHDAEGYQIHALPNDPLVQDDVLDVNESNRMIDFGYDVATDRWETWVFDLPTAAWTNLPGLGGRGTRGRRINASGLVSGGSDDQHGDRFPVTWAPPYATVHKLSRSGVYPIASGNNDQGYSVGTAGRGRSTPAVDNSYQHLGPHQYGLLGVGIVWSPDGSQKALPALHSQSDAYDIDNNGVVVGASDTADPSTRHAVVWKKGVIRDIGGKAGWWTVARGISEGGWTVGGGDDGNVGQAFVWTGVGSLQWLPALTPGGSSNGLAVNSTLRQVGGWAERSDGSAPPTVWQCPAGFTTA